MRLVESIVRIGVMILLVFGLVAATGWGVLAIYYGDSATGPIQSLLAVLFAIIGLLTIACVFVRRWRWRCVAGFSVFFIGVLLWWLNIPPSNDRLWQPEVARLASASVDGNLVTVTINPATYMVAGLITCATSVTVRKRISRPPITPGLMTFRNSTVSTCLRFTGWARRSRIRS